MDKTLKLLKNEFLYEMDYISNIGSKLFVYPFMGRSKRSLLGYYFIYFLLIFASIQLFITLCLTHFEDLFEVINIAPNLGVCFMIVIKFSKMQTNNDVYDKIFQHFRKDLWDVVAESKNHREILNKYTNKTRIIIRCEFYYTVILAVVVNLFPRIIMYYEELINNRKLYLYPFDGWYPFDKVKWYYVVYAWEGFITTIVIFIFVFANMIHISYTRYVCMELKILGNSMESLICGEDVFNIRRNRHIEQTYNKIKTKLKVIVRRHHFLAEITTQLDQVLGDAMLVTYIFGSVFICLTAFTATVVEDLYMTLRYFSFFFSLFIEIFIQCIMGQLLINHSAELERAVYFADWPETDLETKKILLIFLTMTQKPFTFTAKGYLTMNLDTFSGICNLSYQFFNLLRTVYH